MDNESHAPMTPFDELVTSPRLQIMKLIIPYAPPGSRRMLAACVKFMEFREAFRIFGSGYGGLQAQMVSGDERPDLIDMLNSFRPYLGSREAAMLDMVMNLKEMLSVMEMMQSSSSSESDGSSFDPMDLLSGMLSPEQQEMFRMYSDLFSQSTENPPEGTTVSAQASDTPAESQDTTLKGDDIDGRLDEQPGNEEPGSGEAGADTDGSGEDER